MKNSIRKFAKLRPIAEGKYVFEDVIEITVEDGRMHTTMEWHCDESKDIKEYDDLIEQYNEFLTENNIKCISNDLSERTLNLMEQEHMWLLASVHGYKFVPQKAMKLIVNVEVEDVQNG